MAFHEPQNNMLAYYPAKFAETGKCDLICAKYGGLGYTMLKHTLTIWIVDNKHRPITESKIFNFPQHLLQHGSPLTPTTIGSTDDCCRTPGISSTLLTESQPPVHSSPPSSSGWASGEYSTLSRAITTTVSQFLAFLLTLLHLSSSRDS